MHKMIKQNKKNTYKQYHGSNHYQNIVCRPLERLIANIVNIYCEMKEYTDE